MPPIGALGFSPDGSQLWTATRGSIEIRTWPDLSLVGVVPWTRALPPHVADGLPAHFRQAFAFHPAGRLVAFAYRSAVFLLDALGQPLDRAPFLPPGGVLGIAFDEEGRVVIANASGVFTAGPDGALAPLGIPPNGPLPVWVWRAAVAPWARTALYCVNDEAALLYSWETGLVRTEDEWGGSANYGDGESDGDGTSWLGADLAPGGRALVCGKKSGDTWITGLDPSFRCVSLVDVSKPNLRRPVTMKLPMRTSTHAIHPTEDAVVFAEISGYVFHAKLSTGVIERELPRAGAGYAWE